MSQSLRLFVSYSRADSGDVHPIVEALESEGYSVFVDERDLPYAAKWQAELLYHITLCDVALVCLSDTSINSKWVKWEISELSKQQKKLIPLRLKNVSDEKLPTEIATIQTLPSENTFNLETHKSHLFDAIELDLHWIKARTRLLNMAADWEVSDRSSDLLLRGVEVDDAKLWAQQVPAREPPLGEAVLAFIKTSEEQELKSIARQQAELQRRKRLSLALQTTSVVFLLLTLLGGWYVANQFASVSLSKKNAALTSVSLAIARGDNDLAAHLALAIPEKRILSPEPDRLTAILERVPLALAASVKMRHPASITGAEVLPGEVHILSWSEDGTIILWEIRTGEILKRIQVDSISDSHLSLETGILALIDENENYQQLQISNLEISNPIQLPASPRFSDDPLLGKYIAIVADKPNDNDRYQRQTLFLNVETQRIDIAPKDHNSFLTVIQNSVDQEIYIWPKYYGEPQRIDANTGKIEIIERPIKFNADDIIAISPTGEDVLAYFDRKLVVSAAAGDHIKFVSEDVADPTKLLDYVDVDWVGQRIFHTSESSAFEDPFAEMKVIYFGEPERDIAVFQANVSIDESKELWDFGSNVRVFEDWSGGIRTWDLESGELSRRVSVSQNLRKIEWRSDKSGYYAISDRQVLESWRLNIHAPDWRFRTVGQIQDVFYLEQFGKIVVSDSLGNTTVLSSEDGVVSTEYKREGPISDLRYLSETGGLVFWGQDGVVEYLPLRLGAKVSQLRISGEISGFQFNSMSQANSAFAWSDSQYGDYNRPGVFEIGLDSLAEIRRFDEDRYVQGVLQDPTRNRVFTWGYDELRIFTTDGEQLKSIPPGSVKSVHLVQAGDLLIVGERKSVKAYDADSLTELWSLTVEEYLEELNIYSNETRIFINAFRGVDRIVDIQSGEVLREFPRDFYVRTTIGCNTDDQEILAIVRPNEVSFLINDRLVEQTNWRLENLDDGQFIEDCGEFLAWSGWALNNGSPSGDLMIKIDLNSYEDLRFFAEGIVSDIFISEANNFVSVIRTGLTSFQSMVTWDLGNAERIQTYPLNSKAKSLLYFPDAHLYGVNYWNGRFTLIDEFSKDQVFEANHAGKILGAVITKNQQLQLWGDESGISLWNIGALTQPRNINEIRLSICNRLKGWELSKTGHVSRSSMSSRNGQIASDGPVNEERDPCLHVLELEN